MAFKVADLLRLPLLVMLDAVVAQRLGWIWQHGYVLGSILTAMGICLILGFFSCEQRIIFETYRLLMTVAINCVMQGWSFSTIPVIHRDYYTVEDFNTSAFSKLTNHMWGNHTLSIREIDFAAKASVCFAVLQVFHWIILMLLNERFLPPMMIVVTSPAWALMFSVSTVSLSVIIFISEIPLLFLFLKKIRIIRAGMDHIRIPQRNINEVVVDNMFTSIRNFWVNCRVPSVLRLYFIFRCVWGFSLLNGNYLTFSTEEYDSTKNNGLFYYFSPQPPAAPDNKHWEDWDGIGGYFPAGANQRNLTLLEGMSAILTDSLISSFSVGAVISVIGHVAGVWLHDFVGGNDIMHGEALGMMSSILFCLLAIQTGLSNLPPWKRIVRLYRNSFLLLSAILHFFLDVVHPVLMTISPQSHIPVSKHARPLLICVWLLVIPTTMCYWLITTKPLSTWMVALTAFNFELVVKVISTLTVYVLYIIDSRSRTNGIVNLDDYVFYVRSSSHVIEFVCGLVMFLNGTYILFFESSNFLRAIMMSMHAYVNIYRTFREGVKTLNNRRTVNSKIASLVSIKVDEIPEDDRDVCSICYQDFAEDNGEIRKTRCNHLFHSQCLRKWVFIQDSCPMCDQALFPSEDDKRKEN